MPALDANVYFIAPGLQQSFIDKNTGEFLAGGTLTFYADDGQSTLKDVYYLSAPNTLTAFPNPLTLSSIGTVVDPSGNPKMIYWHPYDQDGVVENYLIEVSDSGGGSQFTIENYPGLASSVNPSASHEVRNFVGNGQFRLHNSVADDGTNGAGYIVDNDTEIAPGGHHFVHDGTTGKQFVTFTRESSAVGSAFPRYLAQFSQTGTGLNGNRKDYAYRFKNVNTFSTDDNEYTFVFSARTASGAVGINTYYRQYFGSGGSATNEQSISAETISATFQDFSIPVSFDSTSGKTVGDDDDDYLEIIIRFPIDSPYDISVSNVALLTGTSTDAIYPQTSGQEDAYRALAGGFVYDNVPTDTDTYDGSLIGLPIYLTKEGFAADTSVVGRIESWSYEPSSFDDIPYLKADGSKYKRSGYSPLGIPYSRLAEKYDNSSGIPTYGTGNGYFVTLNLSGSSTITVANNNYGSVTAVSESGNGFTLDTAPVHIGVADGYYLITGMTGESTPRMYLEQSVPYLLDSNALFDTSNMGDPDDGNAGFSFENERIHKSDNNVPTTPDKTISSSKFVSYVTPTSATSLANPGSSGKHWNVYVYTGSTIIHYYVWYQITNETDPSATGTALKVKLESGDSAHNVAVKTALALRGAQVTTLTCSAASGITGTPYFVSHGSDGMSYYVWLNKDGGGTDPDSGDIGIEVAILSADTATEVANKVLEATNKFYFAVPDLEGAFIRGTDSNGSHDPDVTLRYNPKFGPSGIGPGSFQSDSIGRHGHYIPTAASAGGTAYLQRGTNVDHNVPTTYSAKSSGGAESRPYNMSVLYVIRY